MPSSRRGSSNDKDSKGPPEIVHQLGRAVLSYSLKKLAEQKAQPADRSQSSRRKSSRSKTRDASAKGARSSSRDMPRSNSGDLHSLISQLAVGVCAVGVRHLIKRRRDAKRKAAAAAKATATRDIAGTQEQGTASGAVDPELSVALDTVTKELQGASESIRRLAYSTPTSHRNCAVRDALVADADRLTGSLVNMQASINNMRNLHPGLGQGRPRDTPRERAELRDRKSAREGRVDSRSGEAGERNRASARTEGRVRSRRGRAEEMLTADPADVRNERPRRNSEHHPRDRENPDQPEQHRSRRSRRDEEMPHRRRREPTER